MRIDSYIVDMYSNYLSSKNELGVSLKTTNTTQDNFTNETNINTKKPEISNKISTNTNANQEYMLAKISSNIIKVLRDARDETKDLSTTNMLDTTIYESSETEELKIKTKAVVMADGKQLEVDLDLMLQRSFLRSITLFDVVSKFYDPLVIALDGGMPSIKNDRIAFDIDADGEVDQISRLGANSGFLALDLNENGAIDDGSELFGIRSGDGFVDLAKFDDDGNGWIDENDEIFNKLRIWQNNDDGKRLLALGEVGVGAIFLGSAQGNFSFKNDINTEMAKLRSTGLFLFENGRAGAIAQIDFAKRDENDLLELGALNGLGDTLEGFGGRDTFAFISDQVGEQKEDDKKFKPIKGESKNTQTYTYEDKFKEHFFKELLKADRENSIRVIKLMEKAEQKVDKTI
ncbi:hypothetical protein CCAL12920_08095 [Campylobacter sp. RM12920]|uniref:VCBS repeat-containing protein n=1 Tax=Campylobacter californiensis TaxID=1032243 RepID=A0ABD4JIW7_9BACT|nr:hypothetical protein [Campylobacter sp. RM12919]MBE2988837.1 hypothetical protein [Campylobacter sp. RM12920]